MARSVELLLYEKRGLVLHLFALLMQHALLLLELTHVHVIFLELHHHLLLLVLLLPLHPLHRPYALQLFKVFLLLSYEDCLKPFFVHGLVLVFNLCHFGLNLLLPLLFVHPYLQLYVFSVLLHRQLVLL